MKYLVVRRDTMGTSGHETEELQACLDEHAAQGWKLNSIIDKDTQMLLIFERHEDCQ